ncbi:MAG: histidine phosphatase family protein [Candidatus Obscuribacterales bacterium]|nr:histidine phosphatase family protein [Candidatus Obscuribacterales bacterium]
MAEQLHPEETVTSVLFLRHGHTLQTEAGRLYSDPKALLSEQGRTQIEALAELLEQEGYEKILSSTALRVQASAEIIAKKLKQEIILLPGLDEQSVGQWEGRSYLEIKKSDPELYKAWCADPIRNSAPDGESIEDLYLRVVKDLKKMLLDYKGQKLIFVTHAGVIRSAIIEALGMPIDNFWRLNIPTASASKIDYSHNFACLHFMANRARLS